MSREHYVESHLEDRVNDLMFDDGLLREDAIIKATSEYDGQVNLVEDKALRINEKQMAIQKKLRQGVYPSEIVLSKIGDYLESHSNSDSQAHEVNVFCIEMMDQIVDWKKEIANAE